jgi:hypothetical protein
MSWIGRLCSFHSRKSISLAENLGLNAATQSTDALSTAINRAFSLSGTSDTFRVADQSI